MPVHAVHDQLVVPDGGRGRHLAVRRVVLPDHVAVAHVERAHGPLRVRDVGDAVLHHGRELDQRAETSRPDHSERRADRELRLSLGSGRVRAVHRPLKRPPVDPDRRLGMCAERQAHGALGVALLPGAGDERAPVAHRHARDAVAIAARGVTTDRHPSAADPGVRVAIHHRHLNGGALHLGDIGTGRDVPDHGRLRGDGRDRLALRSAGDEQRRSEQERTKSHASSGTASACTGSRVPPASSRMTCEKYLVITTPSRKSPSRGSGCSPFASASASSG